MNLLRNKLCYKLISYIALAAVVFISLISVIFFHISVGHTNSKAEQMINQLIDTVEYTASIAAYTSNSEIAQDVLNGLLRNDVVHKVIITSDRGLLLEKIKDNNKEKNPPEIIRELFSPFDHKKSIGQISVIPAANFIMQEAHHEVVENIINALILTGLLLIFTVLMVHSLFLNPLTKISNTLRDIIVGEQDRIELLENDRTDELGRLVININKSLNLLTTKISTQKALRKRIESIEKKLRDIFQSTSAGLFLLDQDGKVLTCTPTLLRILGYHDTSLVSINGQDFAMLIFKEPEQFKQMMRNALQLEQLEACDLMLHDNKKTNPLWVHCLLSKITDTTGVIRFEGVIFDISKRVASEKAMLYEANHDALTGLLRRNAAELHLRKHLASENSTPTIVMLLDLDGFKKANDTHGHDAGDVVLIETARRLEDCVRHNDIVCRLGGDEFLLILFNCNPNTSFGIAEQIIAAIQQPVIIDTSITIHIGVSIGIALSLMHGTTVETLLKAADEAMYEVKRKGKNGYAIKNKNGSIAVNRPTAQNLKQNTHRTAP
jgi:diguanylate cyclase (GGDEF)-like protein/PAS domain S-box-containing protein